MHLLEYAQKDALSLYDNILKTSNANRYWWSLVLHRTNKGRNWGTIELITRTVLCNKRPLFKLTLFDTRKQKSNIIIKSRYIKLFIISIWNGHRNIGLTVYSKWALRLNYRVELSFKDIRNGLLDSKEMKDRIMGYEGQIQKGKS